MKININLDTWKIFVLVLGGSLVFTQVYDVNIVNVAKSTLSDIASAKIEGKVLPSEGVVLPVAWDGLGERMVETGVIDLEKFEELYMQRGKLDEALDLLNDSELKIDQQNADILLNMFWAFGLSNKNVILEQGPMVDEKYGGDASRFASTGGWRLADGDPMDYYSKFEFV